MMMAKTAAHHAQRKFRHLKSRPQPLLRRQRSRAQNLLAIKLIHERLVRIHLARSLSGKAVQLNAGHRYFTAGGVEGAGARTQRKP